MNKAYFKQTNKTTNCWFLYIEEELGLKLIADNYEGNRDTITMLFPWDDVDRALGKWFKWEVLTEGEIFVEAI